MQLKFFGKLADEIHERLDMTGDNDAARSILVAASIICDAIDAAWEEDDEDDNA